MKYNYRKDKSDDDFSDFEDDNGRRHKFKKKIGQGGFGQVRSTDIDPEFAVKTFSRSKSKTEKEQIESIKKETYFTNLAYQEIGGAHLYFRGDKERVEDARLVMPYM